MEKAIKELSLKIDQMDQKFNQKFEQVDQRFEQIDQRFDQMDDKLDHLERYFDKRLLKLEGRIENQADLTERAIRKSEKNITDYIQSFMTNYVLREELVPTAFKARSDSLRDGGEKFEKTTNTKSQGNSKNTIKKRSKQQPGK